ncbi:ribbon-helix-helix domain-containing protein [Planctobacterium marinum]|uniref:Predicted DNA-binding protein ribbon-helix-helix domain-containing protein n=1 Tax=Planctobacterium marinum TaxID=1631968 RepID=A0AA48HG47_9ALTE|nr:hypothetical protein MACH26_18440 [Planctobacterium marinum]
MPFTSLKRKLPVSEKRNLSLDAFIDDAERYAAGLDNVYPIVQGKIQLKESKKKLRATFSLSCEAKQKLDLCSQKTGIARSRLIRIWLEGLDEEQLQAQYCQSEVE